MVKQKRSTCDAILRQNMSMALWQKRDCLNILEQFMSHENTKTSELPVSRDTMNESAKPYDI